MLSQKALGHRLDFAAANAYMAAKQRLYRDVWRLGLQRHSFRLENAIPKWYDEYVKLKGGSRAKSILDTHKEA